MKTLRHIFIGNLVAVALLLSSCKKQVTEPVEEKAVASLQASATECRPTTLGVLVKRPDGVTRWQTLMQKWFDSNGKLAYLKAYYVNDFNDYSHFLFSMDWGAVTYHGNQVYVTDVPKNKLVLRVTLNTQGMPEATYFYSDPIDGYPGNIDTTYYYYTGMRLDSFFQINRFGPSDPNATGNMWRLSYDMYGNVVLLTTGNGASRIAFAYDYSKPVNGMLGNFQITQPLKLLEYMDLLRLPIHHQLTEVVAGAYNPGYPYDIYPIESWKYENVTLTPGGLVHSYVDAGGRPWTNTLYTGWDCGGGSPAQEVNRQRTDIRTLDDFHRIYPDPRKGK